MLELTEKASTMIRDLLDRPKVPDGSGLRITSEGEGGGGEDTSKLSLRTAAAPHQDDQVIEEEGARVFLGPRAAAILENKVLDAAVDTGGKVRFLVSPQQ